MPRRNLSPEEEERIASLYAEGWNSSQIAKELSLAYQTVQRRVQKFEAVELNGDGVPDGTQGAKALALRAPAARKRMKRNGALEAASIVLTHISTREVYQGELLTFVHDLARETVSIELNGHEPICLSNDDFLMFARDVERMKTPLSDMVVSKKAALEE